MLNFRGRQWPARSIAAAAWLALLTGLVFAEPILWLVRSWVDNPYYAHGPFIPLVSLVLAGVSLPRLLKNPNRGSPLWLVVVAAGLALRLVGAYAGSDLLGALALLIVLAGFAGWWLGRRGWQSLAFPVAYLLFAVPLPFMDDLGFYFQRLSTAATTVVVKLAGVPAAYQGAEVSLPDASFIVGIQCSGLYSTVTLTALGFLFVRMLDLPSKGSRGLLLLAIPVIAVTSNVFRLSSLLGIAYWQSADVAMNYYHNLGDIVFWLLAMGLLFGLGKGLEWAQLKRGS